MSAEEILEIEIPKKKKKKLSWDAQYFLAGALKYLISIGLAVGLAYWHFQIYNVHEAISGIAVALLILVIIGVFKFGKKAMDDGFPDKYKWITKVLGQFLLTGVFIGLIYAVKSSIDDFLAVAVIVLIGEIAALPFVIWQNIARMKIYSGEFGTKEISSTLKELLRKTKKNKGEDEE